MAGSAQPPSWRLETVNSPDLEAGLRAAAQLQALPVPPALGKQVASYILRAGNELAARSSVNAEALPAQ